MLTEQDLNTLIEAVEAWENKDDSAYILEVLTGNALLHSIPDTQRPQVAKKLEDRGRDHEKSKTIRKERSVMLRAKLIQMRDSVAAERLANET